jgi:hypothetical protein
VRLNPRATVVFLLWSWNSYIPSHINPAG